ncbi:MAG: hypothetical protein KDH99_00240 [Alcanivoracaceae bacterium]|jgi:hypothetical protein|nr:hypothetical protein [Alcanivoracaceae bacterium]
MIRLLTPGIQGVFAAGALLLSQLALADAVTLRALNDTRILLDRVNMDYQMFKGENANPRYGDLLQEDIDALADAREEMAGVVQNDEMDAIENNIDRYLELLDDSYSALSSGGYDVNALVDEMMDKKLAAQRGITALYNASVESSNADPRVIEYQTMAFLMQQMAARYLENAAAVFGVAWRDMGDERSIDQLALDFSQRLAKLDLTAQDLPVDARTQLTDVQRKWTFIEQSMMNFMENQVSFLVFRYSNTIVEDLQGAARSLSGDEGISAPERGDIPLPPGIPAAE